ncbi:putative Transcription factor-related [Tripterygium wilfordii]|uniref:Putative Transcription factor-related n=1 Tax=Tripterygium wilfordii TaxID=458696 RepID=A0A7J7C4U1_TRIWF|nr:protein DOG1-like 4 [Tripterygium wilfordii]KAF5729179.1 putative Transcription factor-related [Tripterygium wilfordii]
MKAEVGEKFSEFLERWESQLDDYKQQLMRGSKEGTSEQELQVLVSTVTTHYKEYYTVKWAAAHEDVFAFFSPTWVSPLENAYSWLTGWKPSMAFRLLDSLSPTRSQLTEEQVRKIGELRVKVRLDEAKVEMDMERQQVSMGDRKVVNLARLMNRRDDPVSEADGLVEVALKRLMGGLERVMKSADCVRLKTLKGVLDILTPSQRVDFLAAIIAVQIQLGQLGKTRESHKL